MTLRQALLEKWPRALDLFSSWDETGHGLVSTPEFRKAVAMLGSGLDVSPVISHRFAIDDHKAAFAALRSGEASKVLLEIG